MPLPDAESPEQSLGDCAICMDAILVDPALRQRPDEKNDGHGLVRRTGGLFVQSARKSYSLAPCHHLFVRIFSDSWDILLNLYVPYSIQLVSNVYVAHFFFKSTH